MVLGQMRKRLGDRLGRSPTLTSDQMYGEITSYLHDKDKIVRDQLERLGMRPELSGGSLPVRSDPRCVLLQLSELALHDLRRDIRGTIRESMLSHSRHEGVLHAPKRRQVQIELRQRTSEKTGRTRQQSRRPCPRRVTPLGRG